MSAPEPPAQQRSEAADAPLEVPAPLGALLAKLARQAIRYRLETGQPLPIATGLPPALTQPSGAFVALLNDEVELGCTGTLLPRNPLIENVMASAVDAALNDPRCEPVGFETLDRLTVRVMVLSTPKPIWVEDEAALLARLSPGEDGLILHDGHRRAMFLPAAWEAYPEPQRFVAQLKARAGLMPDHWSPDLQFARYRATTFSDPPPNP